MAGVVRTGEHACSRLAHPADRERLAVGYVQSALARGHKVLYLANREDVEGFSARLAGLDERLAAALESGQLRVCRSCEFYSHDGVFDGQKVIDAIARERAIALGEGYSALCLAGEMSALHELPGGEELVAYERALNADPHAGTLMFLCQYDHEQLGAGALREIADAHEVDIPPELAAIGRDGYLAAARVGRGPSATLRLCGELDFGCADSLASVLGAHYHGRLRFDLQDLVFVDVAGMRALRGRKAQQMTIVGASESVRRLVELLAWDTDPAIEVVAAG
jgi:ABC-type transporter Mla MlaB component